MFSSVSFMPSNDRAGYSGEAHGASSRQVSDVSSDNDSAQLENEHNGIKFHVDMNALLACVSINGQRLKADMDTLTGYAKDSLKDLRLMRADMLEYVNKNTDLVSERLKPGATFLEHNRYLQTLREFSAMKDAIDGVSKTMGGNNNNSAIHIHHSERVYGDLKALKQGRPIPDFKYNNEHNGIKLHVDMNALFACVSINAQRLKADMDTLTGFAKDSLKDLRLMRADTFEYMNENTDQVSGRLKPGATSLEHNRYVQTLREFSAMKDAIDGVSKTMGGNNNNSAIHIHHSDRIYGDVKALKEGRPIPDFKYNSGSLQFG